MFYLYLCRPLSTDYKLNEDMWSTILSVVLIVNELMASNAGEVMSPATNFDSWIELYNPDDQSINRKT